MEGLSYVTWLLPQNWKIGRFTTTKLLFLDPNLLPKMCLFYFLTMHEVNMYHETY